MIFMIGWYRRIIQNRISNSTLNESTLNKVIYVLVEHENPAAVKSHGFPSQPSRQRSSLQSALDVTGKRSLESSAEHLVDEEQGHKFLRTGSTLPSTLRL